MNSGERTAYRAPMRWPWSTHVRDPQGDDLTITVTIQWGLAKMVVRTSQRSPRVWVHGVVIGATVEHRTNDTVYEDMHTCGIRAPIRLSPGGSFAEAWRPTTFDLGDGALHRPSFRALASLSTRRRDPIHLEPGIEVVDDFTWIDGRYELVEGSTLWHATHDPPPRHV